MSETQVEPTVKNYNKLRLTKIESIILDRVADTGLPLDGALANDQDLASYVLEEALSTIRRDLITARLADNNEYLRRRIAISEKS